MTEIEAYPTTGEKGLVNYRHWNAACDHGFRKDFSYMIYPAGSVYKALNGDTGIIDFNDADAAAVIQAIHGALPATGGKIVFNWLGTVDIAAQVDITKPIWFQGLGRESTILRFNANNLISFSITSSNVKFSDMKFTQNTGITNSIAFQADGSALAPSGLLWLSFEDITFWGSNGANSVFIDLISLFLTQIERCYFVSTDGVGVWIRKTTGVYPTTVTIRDCYFLNCLGYPIKSDEGIACTIENNYFEGNVGAGVYIRRGSNKIINNCWDSEVTGTKDLDVYIAGGTTPNKILNNHFSSFARVEINAGNIRRGNTYGTVLLEENSGSATIDDSTSVVFPHGLAGIPTHVNVAFKTAGYGNWIWSADETNITITVANSGTYNLTWDAECKP